jgi:hypothetical protein
LTKKNEAMSYNQSFKSNTNIGGRSSPNFQTTKPDSVLIRSSSPINNRLSHVREHENESPSRRFNDDDNKFHKISFERCAEPPQRIAITNREKFGRGQLVHFKFLKKT